MSEGAPRSREDKSVMKNRISTGLCAFGLAALDGRRRLLKGRQGMTATRTIATVALAAAAGILLAPAPAAAQTGDLYEINMVLRGALFQQSPDSRFGPNLLLDLSRRDGAWWPVRGVALTFNQGSHMGVVVTSDVAEASAKFDILMKIGGDQWIPGGYGRYVVTLTGKDKDGRLTGTYEGSFKEKEVRGEAWAYVKPPRPVRVRDYRPLGNREHPRILFRKADTAKFRERLKTRLGQDTIELLKGGKDHVSLAFLYAATGDRQYAEKALPLIEKEMKQFDRGGLAVDAWHGRCNSIAIAVDLIWDTLPPEFIGQFDEYCDMMSDAVVNKLGVFASGFNFNPCSNYYGPVVGAIGTLSLLLLGEPGIEPAKPLDMLGRSDSPSDGGDAIGRMVTKYTDPKQATAAANDMAWKKAYWEAENAVWKQTGWNVQKVLLFDQVAYQNYKHLRFGIGDGGFQSEVSIYALIAHDEVTSFAAQHRAVTGRDISPYPDATHFDVRHMMTQWFGENGQTHALKINGYAGVILSTVGTGFQLCPDEYKPALLWVWNYLAGVDPANEATFIKAVKACGGPLGWVQAFMNYPLDMKPAHPKDVMPLTWQAPTRGLNVFRSGWEGRDEFICQTFAKAAPIGGNAQQNAGAFVIWGLQRPWVHITVGKKDVRQNLPLVDLPDNQNDEGVSLDRYGIVADLKTEKDGSGSITIDMNEVYGRAKPIESPKPKEVAPPEPSGKLLTARQLRSRITHDAAPPQRPAFIDANFIRLNPEWDTDRMKGLRAFAFDYSGKAGVPCVVAIVDHIEGGKRKVWRIPPPPVTDSKAKIITPVAFAFTNTGFAATHSDGASMRAFFASPPTVKAQMETTVIDKDKRAEVNASVEATSVTVTGPTGEEGDFFVVMTFTRGEQPAVKVEGAGLNAKVTIGQRRYSFDGTRIVME